MAFGSKSTPSAWYTRVGDGLDLLGQRQVVAVGELEVVRLFAQAHHFVGQAAALAALRPHLRQRHVHAQLAALVLHQLELGFRVRGGSG